MAYVYQDTVRGSPRNVFDFPSANEDVLREQFAQTFEENPIKAFQRWNELREDHKTGPKLSAEDARSKLKDAGLESDLKVSDAGITQAALDTLMYRKRVEKRRQEIFARAEGGLGQGAARLGMAFATTLSDPISAGLNFVPIVGQVRYARWLAQAGSMAGRLGVRAGVGAAEGVAGAALAEPFIYGMRSQEQADYDTADSLLNVAFGGVVGSGLHVTVGSVGELYSRLRPTKELASRVEPSRAIEPLPENIRQAIFDQPRAADIVNAMPPDAQQAALRAAVGQAIEGRSINVEPIIQAAPLRQTELPEFRSWFGESKAVTPDGTPMVLYHGTAGDFDKFDLSFFGRTDGGAIGKGLYFTTNSAEAGRIAESAASGGLGDASVLPVHIKAANPVTWSEELQAKRQEMTSEEFTSWLESRGFDSIIKPRTDGSAEWMVFRPEQVKSAIGNSGRFDVNSASLTDTTDPEYKAATEYAENTLAREIDDTTEANLKAAEEEADLAEAEAKELAKRLGVNMADDADVAAINEAAERAERWARAAELATVCLVRGG